MTQQQSANSAEQKFIGRKLAEAEKHLRAREEMEKSWRGGTDVSWRAVGCKMSKAERLKESETQGRIAAKVRSEVEMFKAVQESLRQLTQQAEANKEAREFIDRNFTVLQIALDRCSIVGSCRAMKELRTLSQPSPKAEAKEENCDACGGLGVAPSGPCACGGTGKMSVLAINVRKLYFESQSQLRQLTESNEGLKREVEFFKRYRAKFEEPNSLCQQPLCNQPRMIGLGECWQHCDEEDFKPKTLPPSSPVAERGTRIPD